MLGSKKNKTLSTGTKEGGGTYSTEPSRESKYFPREFQKCNASFRIYANFSTTSNMFIEDGK